MAGSVGERVGSALRSAVPLAEWLPNYERSWLRNDVIAGITVTASVIPEGLAYASLANLPPVTGLYAGLLAAAAYVVFGTSRQVIVGPTSALASCWRPVSGLSQLAAPSLTEIQGECLTL